MTANLDRILDDLRSLVAFPSVSSSPSHTGDVAASADRVAALFRDVGMNVSVADASGAPAVIGRRQGPEGAPTVLLYAHHDVQPVEESSWHSDPFELQVTGDRAFGRGSADDKGAVAVHLEALRAFGDDLPVSIAVLVEGEEEIGSPTLGALLADHADTVRSDVVIVPDAVNNAVDEPTVTRSLRGLLNVRLSVRTAGNAVHSGIHGGVLPDALGTLVHLLDSLTDDVGDVAVEGIDPDPDPQDAYLDARDSATAADTVDGLRIPDDAAARLWRRPAVTVLAIDAPPVERAANILTPFAEAVVSFRLPPSASPDDALAAVRSHINRTNTVGAEVAVTPLATGRGWSEDSGSRYIDLAAEALTTAFERTTTMTGVGGGIPFVEALTSAFHGIVPVITALQDPDSSAHAADESVSLRTLTAAADAEISMLRRFGELR